MRQLRVYIAGPLTKGDVRANLRRALEAADQVLALGHVPFVPHLSFFWDLMSHKHYENWLLYDFAWLDVCDCLIRLPGESAGADREMAYAREQGIPCYAGMEGFTEALKRRTDQ